MNLQEIFFLVCTIGVSVVGTLLTFGEKFLPLWFIDSQIVSYGKLVRKERSKAERFAVPKAWFSHFYIFASSLGWGCLAMAVCVYFYDYQPHRYLLNYLDFFCGKDRTAKSKYCNVTTFLSSSNWNHLSFAVYLLAGISTDDIAMHAKAYRE